jgi:hypothetical protein
VITGRQSARAEIALLRASNRELIAALHELRDASEARWLADAYAHAWKELVEHRPSLH